MRSGALLYLYELPSNASSVMWQCLNRHSDWLVWNQECWVSTTKKTSPDPLSSKRARSGDETKERQKKCLIYQSKLLHFTHTGTLLLVMQQLILLSTWQLPADCTSRLHIYTQHTTYSIDSESIPTWWDTFFSVLYPMVIGHVFLSACWFSSAVPVPWMVSFCPT